MHGEQGLQSRCRAGQSRGADHAPVLLAIGQGASCRALAAAPRGSSCLGVEPSGRHGKGSGEGAERGGSVSRGGPQLPGLTLACLVVMGRQGGCSWTAESSAREVQLSSGAVAIRTPGSWAGDTHGKGAPAFSGFSRCFLGGQ